ncbi:MAG: hypothetical protein JWP63_6123 [Candidatus Solibacter sp.]|jgi:hypothetical protein|nr:hypothetical protein [Candidatus Solibacter sp.]
MNCVLISGMLETEKDPEALDSKVATLGHPGDERGIPPILRYLNHSEKDMRFTVSCSLGCFPNDPQSIDGLMKLT